MLLPDWLADHVEYSPGKIHKDNDRLLDLSPAAAAAAEEDDDTTQGVQLNDHGE